MMEKSLDETENKPTKRVLYPSQQQLFTVNYPTPFLARSMRVRALGLSSLAAIQER